LFGSLAMISFALALVLHPPLCALHSDTGDIIKSMFCTCALRTVQNLQCSHSQGSNPIRLLFSIPPSALIVALVASRRIISPVVIRLQLVNRPSIKLLTDAVVTRCKSAAKLGNKYFQAKPDNAIRFASPSQRIDALTP
jgi:hypothetical protein